MRSLLTVPVLCLAALCLLLCTLLVVSDPIAELGPVIEHAHGVSLSPDGARAFVVTYLLVTAIYVIPLPINASTDLHPPPFWTAPRTPARGISFIAASSSTSPELLYLLDNQNAQLLSLPITGPAANTSLVYYLGAGNAYLVGGMTYNAASGRLYFTLNSGFDGGVGDRVVVLDPTSSSPSLVTLYTDPLYATFAGIVVSSAHIFFGTITRPTRNRIAQVWRLPISAMNDTQPTLMYTTTNTDLTTLRVGDLVSPAAFALDATETILYVSDAGDQGVAVYNQIQGVYAISPLQPGSANLSVVCFFDRQQAFMSRSLALDVDQSTVYFARRGGSESGLWTATNASSAVPTPLVSSSSSTGGASSSPTRATSSTTSAPRAPTATPSASSSASTTATSVSAGALTAATGRMSSTSSPPADRPSGDEMGAGKVVGIIIGVLIALLVVGCGIVLLTKRCRKTAPSRSQDLEQSLMSDEPNSSTGYIRESR